MERYIASLSVHSSAGMTAISFEFYPPKTDDQRKQLDRTAARLQAAAPAYVSVTFGAGGSSLSQTPETIQRLRDTQALEAAPDINRMGRTRAELRDQLTRYEARRATRPA